MIISISQHLSISSKEMFLTIEKLKNLTFIVSMRPTYKLQRNPKKRNTNHYSNNRKPNKAKIQAKTSVFKHLLKNILQSKNKNQCEIKTIQTKSLKKGIKLKHYRRNKKARSLKLKIINLRRTSKKFFRIKVICRKSGEQLLILVSKIIKIEVN